MRHFLPLKNVKFPRLTVIHLPYFFLLAFVTFPQLGLFHHDFWDGSRIGYAQDSNDFSGVRFWFFSASVEGQFFQEYYVNKVADLLSISALLLDHALVTLGLLVLIREVTIFSRDYLRIRTEILVIPGLIVAIFPSISLTVSSVLVYYITSLALGWYSARKFSNSTGLTRLLAFLGMVYTFEYAVMLLVCPILVLFYSSFHGEISKKDRLNLSLPTLTVVISAFVFKTIMMMFNQPDGPWLGYNQLRIPATLDELSQFAYGAKSYSSFFLYPILILLPAWIISYFSSKDVCQNQEDSFQPRLARVLVAVILLSSVFPYLAVGKSTSLLWLDFWSGRHSFALIPSLAILSASALDWFLQRTGSVSKAQLRIVVASSSVIVICLSSLLYFRVLSSKYLEQQNRLAVAKSIESVKDLVLPGVANVYLENAEFMQLNPDEANYLMYKATGNLNTYSTFTNSGTTQEIPSEILTGNKVQKWTLYSFPDVKCTTEIRIRRLSKLSQFPKMVINPEYLVRKIESSCPK